MKFLLEILIIFVLFYVVRKGLRQWFPVSQIPIELSEDTKREFKIFYRRYILVYSLISMLSAVLIGFILRWFYDFVHNSEAYEIYYAIDDFSIFLPALIGGFLVAIFLAKKINNRMQSDGLAFFLLELQDNWEGFNRRRVQIGHVFIVVVFLALLIYNQTQVYFLIDGKTIKYSTGVLTNHNQEEDEIKKVIKSDPLILVFKGGDTLSMGQFAYNRQDVLQALKE